MKRLIILGILFLTLVFNATAQQSTGFRDSISRSVKSKTIEGLHHALVNELQTDKQKVRAFYIWITHHINYDVNESRKPSSNITKQQPEQVLQRKLAVCHGYSVLFKTLCDLSGIKCYLVSGYTRYDNTFIDEGHTWNMVQVEGGWLPVDATWGAGGVDSRSKYVKQFDDFYFLTDPKEFLKSHYALDPAFQLINHPVALKDYKRNNWEYKPKNKGEVYNYNDTIYIWSQLDSIQQRVRSATRMIQLNPSEPKAKREYNYAMIGYASFELNKGNAILGDLYPNKKSEKTSGINTDSLTADQKDKLLDVALNNIRKADMIFDAIKPMDQKERSTIQMGKNVIKQNIRFIESKKAN